MKGLELKTVQSYESHVRNLDAFCKREGFRSVSKEAAKAFVSYLIDNNYHPTTINAHKVTFNIFFNVLKKEKVVRQNPFSDIERVEGASEVRSHFTVGQLELVKKTLIDKDLQHIEIACQYLYYLLCRPKELRLLKISNVNFQDWSIKISWRVGKKKKARFAIVPDGLKAWMIDNKISEYPLGHYLISKSGLPGEAPVGINFWSSKFTEILRGLGFDESYVLYSIKNTGAITWYKALRDIIAVQRQIGHEDTKTTQIYLRSLGVSDFDYVRPLIPLF
jgi:site-specific recombinase XerD